MCLAILRERVDNSLRRFVPVAADPSLKRGKPLKEGESVARLAGYAAYVYMSDPALGKKYLAELEGLAAPAGGSS